MRTLTLALMAATVLALTAVTAFTAVGEASIDQRHQVRSGGLGVIGPSGFLHNGAYEKFAKSDMMGNGGGGMMGGMMGNMMGSMGRG